MQKTKLQYIAVAPFIVLCIFFPVYSVNAQGGSKIHFPEGIVAHSNGKIIVADTTHNRIRVINKKREIHAIAGTGEAGYVDGAADQAQFSSPKDVDVSRGVIYVADTGNNRIRVIENGVVSTLVDGLNAPEGVKVFGDVIYISDTGNNALKSVDIQGGEIRTITTNLDDPKKIDVSPNGKKIYVANNGTHQIYTVNAESGAVAVVAGTGKYGMKDGMCKKAVFENIWSVHVYKKGALIVGTGNGYSDSIRRVKMDQCTVTTLINDSTAKYFRQPRAITSYKKRLYVLSSATGHIQKFMMNTVGKGEKFFELNTK